MRCYNIVNLSNRDYFIHLPHLLEINMLICLKILKIIKTYQNILKGNACHIDDERKEYMILIIRKHSRSKNDIFYGGPLFFLSECSLTNIHNLEDIKGRGRLFL